jgi:hypothetical protein
MIFAFMVEILLILSIFFLNDWDPIFDQHCHIKRSRGPLSPGQHFGGPTNEAGHLVLAVGRDVAVG